MPDTVKSAFSVAWREAAQEAAREAQAVKDKAAEEVKAALKQFHGAIEAIEKLERHSSTLYCKISTRAPTSRSNLWLAPSR
jgi:hypothetical protein